MCLEEFWGSNWDKNWKTVYRMNRIKKQRQQHTHVPNDESARWQQARIRRQRDRSLCQVYGIGSMELCLQARVKHQRMKIAHDINVERPMLQFCLHWNHLQTWHLRLLWLAARILAAFDLCMQLCAPYSKWTLNVFNTYIINLRESNYVTLQSEDEERHDFVDLFVLTKGHVTAKLAVSRYSKHRPKKKKKSLHVQAWNQCFIKGD